MYGLDRLMLDFNIHELVAGVEVCFDGCLYIEEKKRSIIKNDYHEELTVLRGNYTDNLNGEWETAEVVLSHDQSELVRTECTCRQFGMDRYACKHVTGVLISGLVNRLGVKALRGTELEKELIRKTGIENPFEPGALRRSDRGLARILGKAVPTKKASFDDTVKTEKLHAEYHLDSIEQEIAVSLKVGSKKMYVVKTLDDFFNSYDNNLEYAVGKEKVMAGREAFDEADTRILDYVHANYSVVKKTLAELNKKYYVSASVGRTVTFSGTMADELMDSLKGRTVYINKKPYIYSDRDCALDIKLNKFEFGAEISMKQVNILGNGKRHIYAYDDNGIFALPSNGNRMAMELISSLNSRGFYYVSEQDLRTVCTELLPSLRELANVDTGKMELERYIPENPKFEMYLDYPQDDLISCRAYAVYSDGKYSLFQKVDNIGFRNMREEQRAESILRPIFSAFEEESSTLFLQCNEEKLFDFLAEKLDGLKNLGEIFVSEALQKLKARPVSSVQVGISIESGLLDIKINSELFSRNELQEIFSSYTGKKRYHRLKDGSFVSYTDEQADVMSTIAEFYQNYAKKGQIDMKVPLFRAMYLDESLKDRDSVSLDKSRDFRRLVKNINTAQDGDYEAPSSIRKILRGYQREGFRWMKTLKNNGFGGILADDMGLGKTLQVLAFLLSEKEEGKTGDDIRTLIVTPASLVYNWQREIEKFTPQLTIKVITGQASARQSFIADMESDADVWITSYDLLKRDLKEYERVVFANEFIDEAQFIKNQTTQASKAVRLVSAGFRMALTGTPIENRLSELWSIFDYLMPGFLYTYSHFRADYEAPIMSGKDEDAMERLRRMVHPFILRRLKGDVLKELPEKLEETIAVELTGEQKKLYSAYEQRLKMYLDDKSDEDFRNSKIEILAELTKLRQICCSPDLILENYEGESAKLDTCMELVEQAVSGGHKILLFSQFTTMLDGIGRALKERGIDYYRIDGSTTKENRMKYVDAFQTDAVPVFCISLKAGGTGLNLTAADIVIHYDPWWNIAAQNQATDRTHRIGQKNVVTVYQLIAEDTIEDRIQKLQQSKYELANEVLSGESISSIMIDKNEILNLLG